jgi:hypothetical protein
MVILLLALLLLATPVIPTDLRLLVQKQKGWVELALLASMVICAVHGAESSWKGISGRFRKYMERKRILRYLHDLAVPEKHVLQIYMERGLRTENWSLGDDRPRSLVQQGILKLAPGNHDMYRPPYLLVYDVWAYLQKHPDLIATPNNPRPMPTGREWMRL